MSHLTSNLKLRTISSANLNDKLGAVIMEKDRHIAQYQTEDGS